MNILGIGSLSVPPPGHLALLQDHDLLRRIGLDDRRSRCRSRSRIDGRSMRTARRFQFFPGPLNRHLRFDSRGELLETDLGLRLVQLRENINQIIDTYQIAILVVAHCPGTVMVNNHVLGQLYRLGKVDQPDAGIYAVVDEEERASDNFVRREEVRRK